jgi:hypothetical protein
MQDIAYKTRALLDEYTDEGIVIGDEDVADINAKVIKFADMAYKELYSVARIEKKFEFSNVPFPNLLGDTSNFNQVDFVGADQVYPADGSGKVGAKAYYFESTGAGTAYVEEYNGSAWVTLTTIIMPVGTSYVAYKGIISASNGNYPIRLRFSGTTWYRHVNRCLFSTPFAASQIPSYRPWVPVTLPTDFMDMSQVVSEYPERQYSKDVPYFWENPNTLYIDYYFNGSYRAIYKPIPEDITSLSQTIECNPVIAQAIPYYCAAKIAPYENKSIVSFCQSEYERLKLDAKSPKPMTWENVNPTYTIGGGY